MDFKILILDFICTCPWHLFFLSSISRLFSCQVWACLDFLKPTTETVERFWNRVLALSIEHIIKPITHLINLSMTTHILPYHPKTTEAIPLFKKDDLPICYNFLIKFSKIRNILYGHQYSIRETYSTNLALIEAADGIYSNPHNDLYGIVIYLELWKYLMTAKHNILLY